LIHASVGFLREIRAFAYGAQQSLKVRVTLFAAANMSSGLAA
jgi:hypothetical protein